MINITEKIIGVPFESVELEDIINYFKTAQDESDILEFKSFYEKNQSNFKIKESAIFKTICAFLNSNGGLLIWGAPVGTKEEGRKEKIFIGELSPVTELIEKDTFMSKVVNKITPVANGIKFKSFTVKDGEYVYLIEVPDSLSKPHQFDNRYFMRLDGQTNVAPHHYIEALFKQIRYPEVGGYIQFKQLDTNGNTYELQLRIYLINHSPFLNEENAQFTLSVIKGDFKDSHHYIGNKDISFTAFQFTHNNFAPILHYGTPNFFDITVNLWPQQLAELNREVTFYLNFGGKLSPMKQSVYKLRFDNSLPLNSNTLITEKEENVLFYDLGKDKGEESEKVDKLLER